MEAHILSDPVADSVQCTRSVRITVRCITSNCSLSFLLSWKNQRTHCCSFCNVIVTALFVACAAWLCLFPFQLASLVWQCVLLGCNHAAAATFRCVFGDAQTETLLFLPPDCFYCPFYCLCCLVVSVAATSPSQLASFGEPDFVLYHVGAFPANKVGLPPPPPAAAAA